MKQYLLSIYQPEGDPPEPQLLDEVMRRLDALNQEMQEAGVWVFAAGLHHPSTATVLQARGDEVLMTDGPFAEGKEYLGGFTIIQTHDLDSALEWGSKLARVLTNLSVELRPFADEG